MSSRTIISEVIDSGLVTKFKKDLTRLLNSDVDISNQIWQPVKRV